jgi:hypothetical protein
VYRTLFYTRHINTRNRHLIFCIENFGARCVCSHMQCKRRNISEFYSRVCQHYIFSSIHVCVFIIIYFCRSQWPRGLRRRSAAVRLLGLRVRIPPGGHGCLSLVSVVCCQVEISASGWSLVQRGPTDCGVSECDGEASILRMPWPTTCCCAIVKKGYLFLTLCMWIGCIYFIFLCNNVALRIAIYRLNT